MNLAVHQFSLAELGEPPGGLRLSCSHRLLSLPYSSGATEGNVNRLKGLKRQMYGRASLDPLHKRIILHTA